MNELKKLVINGTEYAVTDDSKIPIPARGKSYQVLQVQTSAAGKPGIWGCGDVAIVFTIGSSIYFGISGMTWAQWCDSYYNTDGYTHDGRYVFDVNEDYVGEQGQEVDSNLEIRCGAEYDIL